MALVPTTLVGTLTSSFASAGLVGSSIPQLASAIGQAMVPWVLFTSVVNTFDTGTAGVGIGTGTVSGLIPAAMASTLTGTFAANALLGSSVPQFIQALSNGIVPFLQTAQVSTTHPGVAIGSGSGKVTGFDPGSLITLMGGTFPANGLIGPNSAQLISALSQGLSIYLNASMLASVIIAGAPAPVPPVPGAGAGIGKLL